MVEDRPAEDGSDMAESPDGDLVRRLCAHDFDALGVLFDRYYTQVYRTAAAITRDSAIAEDVAQDCFLRLYQYAHRIDTTLPLMPWLYRVTVNLSYTFMTRRQKRRVSLEALVDQLMTPSTNTPEVMAERGEVEARVRAAVAALPLNQRAVVALHYLSGQSLEEIAELLDCPLGTVKSRLYYAREALRRQLGDFERAVEVAHGYSAARWGASDYAFGAG
jgi:RNA polymerase sigma-70 factor (ECF subfamily)